MNEIKEEKEITFNNLQATRKTVLLTAGLSIVLILSFGIAYFFTSKSLKKQQIPDLSKTSVYPTINPSIINASLSMIKTNDSTVDIVLDTGGTKVSGVQLELSYDPNAINHITLTPGTFFKNPTELQNTNTVINAQGHISYVLGLNPTEDQPKAGKDTIATLKYSLIPNAALPVNLSFLPQTSVTSPGINYSIVRYLTGILLP